MVRVVFASEEDNGLESKISYHFGRCPYYIFVDVRGEVVESVKVEANPFFNAHQPGMVPKFLAEKRADVVISGGMGPRALQFFREMGIKPITGVSGKVGDILKKYLKGELEEEAEPCR